MFQIIAGKYTSDSAISPIMFSCFDNMQARKDMFANWRSDSGRELFIDGRMTAETGEIYFITKGREEAYEKTLFNDDEVEDLPCSFKATSHNGAMIASQMVSGLNNYLANKSLEIDIRDVPFKLQYMLDTFYYKTESND
jgi:hypothetical protein